MSEPHGSLAWTELLTRDVDAAKAYYERVCGWKFNTMPLPDGGGEYHLGQVGDGPPIVGMMDMNEMPHLEGQTAHWVIYVAVDDVDKAAEETVAAGGEVLGEPFDVEGVGRIAMVRDASGAELGFMKSVAT